MKVAFLNATGQLGGAERVLILLLKALRKERPDWSLQVIAGDAGPLIRVVEELGFDVELLPMPQPLIRFGEASSTNPVAIILAGIAALRYRNRLRSLLARRKPDILHTFNFKMHLLAACSMVPGICLCWHMHDFVAERVITRTLLRALSRRPAWIVAISESVAREMRLVSKLPERVRTILNAVDIGHFNPAGPSWPSKAEPSIGLIATFARWKGHRVFLQAVAALPFPVQAYIAGGALYKTEGSQISLQEIQSLVCELGLSDRVTLTGFLEDTAPLLRTLDVVVHASTEPEPFGLTIAEGLACGRAVVASVAGGVSEILEDGVNGLGHAPGDVQGLARAIEMLLRNPELREKLGSAARIRAETQLDPRRMAKQFIELYASC